MINFRKVTLTNISIFLLGYMLQNVAIAEQLAPPTIQVIDEFGVNVASSQVTTKVNTVAIGGQFGLSHGVSSHTSNFLMQNSGGAYIGLNDKYSGNAIYTKVFSEGVYDENDIYSGFTTYPAFKRDSVSQGIFLMKVHDHESSADFKVMQGTQALGYAGYITSNYFYEAMGDKRNKLEVPAGSSGQLKWTKPDGTEVWYDRGTEFVTAISKGWLNKVVYPNGFTLYFKWPANSSARVTSVTTNTGYQLKYNYVHEASVNVGIGAGYSTTDMPPESNETWSKKNPKSIVGINNVIAYCGEDERSICVDSQNSCPTLAPQFSQNCKQLSNQWPTAKFIWPAGMPRAFFFGENSYSVVDSANRTTTFDIKAYDKYADENGNQIFSGSAYQVGKVFLPRLKSVKSAGAQTNAKAVNYTYKNYANSTNGYAGFTYSVPGELGLVATATGILGGENYYQGILDELRPNLKCYRRKGAEFITIRTCEYVFGAMTFLDNLEGRFNFHEDYRNFLYESIPIDGPRKKYFYDPRGNLSRITINDTETINASYPTTCSNRRTCNQATSISDANGQVTNYTYHEQSGQIETVTLPANKNGVRAKTRYGYTALSANYLTASGLTTGTPIWLKTSEKTCIGTATVGDACAGNSTTTAAQDEVITRYEYNADKNLTLTAMTVTAADTSGVIITKRTCYQYDIYGNRIGETQPKANLASCN